jgi:hypothetical protein
MLITKLKQQTRHGQTPPANQSRNTPPVTPTNMAATPALATVNEQVQQLAQSLANQMVSEMRQSQIISRNGRTYTRFDAVNDIVSNQTEVVTAGLWSDNLAALTTFFTSSTETTSQRRYYIDVLQDTPSADGAAVQYSLAYGNALGSGSDSQGQLNDSISCCIFPISSIIIESIRYSIYNCWFRKH